MDYYPVSVYVVHKSICYGYRRYSTMRKDSDKIEGYLMVNNEK